MAEIHFYEKPGCINNALQKEILRASGHRVIAHDLLNAGWTPDLLRPFFAGLPAPQWCNRSSPRIRSGEIDFSAMDARAALQAMVADPLLIRRPLMRVDGEPMVGFDLEELDRKIGLRKGRQIGLRKGWQATGRALEICPREGGACP